MPIAEVPVTSLRVSVVIPCLNEAMNIGECVTRARAALERTGIAGEVLVVDNGSDDGSGELARQAGATVIDEDRRGYGSAYLAGFNASRGEYIVMIDADLTYDFDEIPRFVERTRSGGRSRDGQPDEPHRARRDVAGQPGRESAPLRVPEPRAPVACQRCPLWASCGSTHGPPALDLHSSGMEFASEMVIRAAKVRLDIRELPIELHQRGGESKLSPFRDGWRHLRLILQHNPTALFIVPGVILTVLGVLAELTVFLHISVFGRPWYIHTVIAGSALVIVGFQVVGLGLCGRAYNFFVVGDHDSLFEGFGRRFTLEQALVAALALFGAGLALGGIVVSNWVSNGFGSLGQERLAILAMTLVVAGIQVFFTSFLISLLGLRRKGSSLPVRRALDPEPIGNDDPLMVEYASVLSAVSFFVASLSGAYGSLLPSTTTRATANVATIARAHKVSGPQARAAYAKAPFRRPELRYLYTVGWIGSASNFAACKAAQILGPDPSAAATQSLEASPAALAALRASHVTIAQAAAAIGKGTTDGCALTR